MHQITIRKSNLLDISKLAMLLKEIEYNDYVKENGVDKIEQSIRMQFELYLHDQTHILLIAEDIEQNLLGYSMIHIIPHLFLPAPEVYISDLFIKPNFRGKDLGTSFIEFAKKFAIEKGCHRLGLLNGRDRESYKRSFYAKNGFIERPNLANFIYFL